MGASQLQLMDPKSALFYKKETNPFARIKVEMPKPETLIVKHNKIFESALGNIFPSKQEETRIQKARIIMGDDIKDLPDEELEVFLTEFQYLIDCWLDEYEKQVFNNQTLRELMKEG